MRRKLSLPVRLAILVAGTSLPLIGFSAALVYQHYTQAQQDAFNRVLQVTRSIQLVLDREMQGIVSGLTVLAGSDSLAREDFESFRSRVQGFLTQFPGHPSIPVRLCQPGPIVTIAISFSRRESRFFRSSLSVLSQIARS